GFDLRLGVREQFALVQRGQTPVIVNVIQQRFCDGGFCDWLVHCESPVARFWALSGTGRCGGKLPPSRWQREFKIKQMGAVRAVNSGDACHTDSAFASIRNKTVAP